MIGNLHLYEGPTEVHEYAEALRDLGGHLVPRTFLLWVDAHRPDRHVRRPHPRRLLAEPDERQGRQVLRRQAATTSPPTSPAARCAGPGPIIGLYLLFHLADLTWGWLQRRLGTPATSYNNVYVSMEAWPIAIIYVAANVVLAIHIFHGAWSMFQTLGINNPRYSTTACASSFARGIAGLILIGNLSFPLAVQGGLIDIDNHTPWRPTTSKKVTADMVTLDAKIPDGPIQDKWDNHKFNGEARQPGQQAQVRRHRRRHRSRRRLGRGLARRARVQREGLHLSTTRPAGRTRSPPRAASTRRRTTATTATRSTASSTTP